VFSNFCGNCISGVPAFPNLYCRYPVLTSSCREPHNEISFDPSPALQLNKICSSLRQSEVAVCQPLIADLLSPRGCSPFIRSLMSSGFDCPETHSKLATIKTIIRYARIAITSLLKDNMDVRNHRIRVLQTVIALLGIPWSMCFGPSVVASQERVKQ